MNRVILHCDMNSFYASVAILSRPHLKRKPVAVAGNPENRSGIILACSTEAKARGVKTAETIWQAKAKCPNLVLIAPEYERYVHYSKLAQQIYYSYTNQVEPFGLDECWLDCTKSQRLFGEPYTIGETIRKHIKKVLGLTISVGVSYNKIFAKLASDIKKPDAVTCLNPSDLKTTIWSLPADAMIGVGKSTSKILNHYGIHTLGDLAKSDERFIQAKLGKKGLKLLEASRGNDFDAVRDYHQITPPKSISKGLTLVYDTVSLEEIKASLLSLAESVSHSLTLSQFRAKGVQLIIKDNTFITHHYQKRFDIAYQSTAILYQALLELFLEKHTLSTPIRAISVGVLYLEPIDLPQMQSLFEEKSTKKHEHLHKTIFSLNERYGKSTISYLRTYDKNPLPKKQFEFNPFLS